METGPNDGCRLAILVRHKRRRGYRARLEMPSGIIVFFYVIVATLTRILVEMHMALARILSLDIAITIAVVAEAGAKAVIDG